MSCTLHLTTSELWSKFLSKVGVQSRYQKQTSTNPKWCPTNVHILFHVPSMCAPGASRASCLPRRCGAQVATRADHRDAERRWSRELITAVAEDGAPQRAHKMRAAAHISGRPLNLAPLPAQAPLSSHQNPATSLHPTSLHG